MSYVHVHVCIEALSYHGSNLIMKMQTLLEVLMTNLRFESLFSGVDLNQNVKGSLCSNSG